MAKATSSEIAHASTVGTRQILPNGDVVSTARHPNSADHVIRVRYRKGVVMEGTVHHEPISIVTMRQKKIEGEAKARAEAEEKGAAEKKAAGGRRVLRYIIPSCIYPTQHGNGVNHDVSTGDAQGGGGEDEGRRGGREGKS
jgi:hypothetical protein